MAYDRIKAVDTALSGKNVSGLPGYQKQSYLTYVVSESVDYFAGWDDVDIAYAIAALNSHKVKDYYNS